MFDAMEEHVETEVPVTDEVVELFIGKIYEYIGESALFIKNANLRCNVCFDSINYKCRSKDDYLQKCSHLSKLYPRFCHRVVEGVPISYFQFSPTDEYSRSNISSIAGDDVPFTIVLTCASNAAKQKWGITSANYVIEHGIQTQPGEDTGLFHMLNSQGILQKFVQYHSSHLESFMSTDNIDIRDNISSFVRLRSDKTPSGKKNGNLGNFINSNIYAYTMQDIVAYFKAHGDANPPTADFFAPTKHDNIFKYR